MSVQRAEVQTHFAAMLPSLAVADLDALAGEIEPMQLADGEAFLEEGHPSDSLYVIADGRAVVSIKVGAQPTVLGVLGHGALFGEVSFMDQGPATATVRASGALRLLRLRRAPFEALAATHPAVTHALMRALCATASLRIGAANTRCDEVLRVVDPQTSLPNDQLSLGVLDYFRLFFHKHGA